MHRRKFLSDLGTVSAAGLALAAIPAGKAQAEDDKSAGKLAPRGPKTWLFWDLWHLDRATNLALRQGVARWREDGTYVDPLMFGHNCWPTVYRDEESAKWRMLYSIAWKPFTLMLAESDDGVRWRPAPQPQIKPVGKKLAPHHLYTLESGSAGGVYDTGRIGGAPRFVAFAHQQGKPVFERALKNPQHRWHAIAKAEGDKRYFNEELTLVSHDGVQWKISPNGAWGLPDWHPEPPIFGFYNEQTGRHAMTVRPGWGDRRVCMQTSDDLTSWSGPELLFQPDVHDRGLVQHYGMPVFRYGRYYVGLLWVFHCSDSGPVESFNQFQGPIDVQLAYSFDGQRFQRGLREPLVPLNSPPHHGCGGIQSSCLVETDDELRIYSGAGKIMHGMSRFTPDARRRELFSIVLHTLRKDGFMYLASRGDWGEFLTKPLVLLDPKLTVNAEATFGEVRFQITDMESRPVAGFTFDDCLPLKEADSLAHPIAWRNQSLAELTGKVIRLEVKLRNARLYAFRGDHHFLDAQDRWMLDDGKEIDTTQFDF